MKAVWDNLFFDMEHCGINKETFAQKAGDSIRDDLRRIERAIRDHDGKAALAMIEEMARDY